MAGWSPAKRARVESAFYEYLNRCVVNSKDEGYINLGERLFWGQKHAITRIFDCLETDVRSVYILKSRQLGMCYAPHMRVLTDDLRWIQIKNIKPGDRLIAVDEMPSGGKGGHRRMRTTTVLATRYVGAVAYKLTLGDGTELVATGEHRHLCKKRRKVDTEWRAVFDMQIGDEIRCITDPWSDSDFEDGWMGGLLDGEGSISKHTSRNGTMVSVSQVPGVVLERARNYLTNNRFSFREEIDNRKGSEHSKLGSKPVHKFEIGRADMIFRLLGKTRPSRFVNRQWWESKELPGKKSGYGWKHVVKIEMLPFQLMIDLQTSHKTFICEGVVSHNSTLVRALTVFLLGVHRGLKGAVIFDTDLNRGKARLELTAMIRDLPASLRFPAIDKNNRDDLLLKNASSLLFLSAGVKKSKAGGTLGRSTDLTIAHCSELCSWDNPEGLEALRNAFSDIHPDRLYIYESTARGYNDWNAMWEDARADPDHNACIFLGWWSKDSQRIDKSEPDFQKYGYYAPTEREKEKIKLVKEKYGYDVSVEQLAWYRRKIDPAQASAGDADINYEADPLKVQEQPWHEEEAFQQGAVFFAAAKLTEQVNEFVLDRGQKRKVDRYVYTVADEFDKTRVNKISPHHHKWTELKVWEEPARNATYVLGVDPAYGENENNDRSAIEIFRCYSDGLDQVAEYAYPLVSTQQLAWVLATLLGWYGSVELASEARYILELNGPGTSVFTELKALKQKMELGYRKSDVQDTGLARIFHNVRAFVYARPDSLGVGSNWHFKTNMNLKVTIMEDLRNLVLSKLMRIRSMDLIKEMSSVARDGDSIRAPGMLKDDRVIASAFAAYYWKMNIRPNLIAQRRTRESETARQEASLAHQVYLFNQNNLASMFEVKRKAHVLNRQLLMRRETRFGRR